MSTLISDIRYAIRRLSKRPGFTAVALLSLALGIGANTAIFTVVNTVVLRKPPLAHPDRVVDVYMDMPQFEFAPLSYPDFEDVRDATRDVFSGFGVSTLSLAPRDLGDHVETLFIELVSGDFFTVLGMRPAAGRLLLPDDDIGPGSPNVVMLSYDYWQSSFDGDPGAVGTTIRLSGQTFTVVGVAPEAYGGTLKGLSPALYAPITLYPQIVPLDPEILEHRGSHSYFAKALLAPGVTMAQADVALDAMAAQLREDYPRNWPGQSDLRMVPTVDVILYPAADGVLVAASAALMVVVGLVLLIACANLASFLLARATDRRREIAVRLAMGARRGALIRQLLTETVLLALVGGALGMLLAIAALQVLASLDLRLVIPITLDLAPDTLVLGFTAAISVLAGIIFGLVPALQTTNPDLAPTLKDESTGGAPVRYRLRAALVSGQLAVSLVVLVVAGLFVRSFQERLAVDPGFGYHPAAVVSVGIDDRYEDAEAARTFIDRLLEELVARPDIVAAGTVDNLMLNALSQQSFTLNVDGVDPPPGLPGHNTDYVRVSPGFFDAVGIPLLQGRNFSSVDTEDSPDVVIVSRTFAERYWPGTDAVGQVLRDLDGDPYRVIGVAEDTKVRTLGEATRPFLYRPFSQTYTPYVTIVASTRGSAQRALQETVETIRSLDPDLVLVETETISEHLSTMVLPARLGAGALAVAGALALALVIIGLYGIVSYAVAARAREVGIRMSLGAEPGQVVRLLMGGGMRLVVIGGVVGMVLALLLSQVLRTLLYGVGAVDLRTFLGVPVLLLAVAALATWVPARRASRVDPVRTLRTE